MMHILSPVPSARPCRRPRRAMTMIEVMLSVTILTVLSTAVFYLLLAAANCDRYTSTQTSAVSETDNGCQRIFSNATAAIPSSALGMTPTVSTDANGQSRLTFIVPDIANNTTRTLVYYCTGSSAPYTLVEDDPRYDAAGVPNTIIHNISSFRVTLDASTSMKIWITLQTSPPFGIPIPRHFCIQCRDF